MVAGNKGRPTKLVLPAVHKDRIGSAHKSGRAGHRELAPSRPVAGIVAPGQKPPAAVPGDGDGKCCSTVPSSTLQND